jgi:hypothetical protein
LDDALLWRWCVINSCLRGVPEHYSIQHGNDG